jgi:anti-anti-sigma factor
MSHTAPLALPHLRSHRIHGHTVLEFHGAIDIAAAVELMPHVDAETSVPRSTVVIDLTPATFFDCSGVRLLCRTRLRATAGGGHLLLVCPHPAVLRLLDAVHLTGLFHPFRTLDEVLAGHTAARG